EHRAVLQADPRDRRDVQQAAEVKAPGVAVDTGFVLALDANTQGATGDGGIVDRRKEVDLSLLIADAAADACAVAQLERHGGVDVDRLYFRLDALAASDPVRRGLGGERDGNGRPAT